MQLTQRNAERLRHCRRREIVAVQIVFDELARRLQAMCTGDPRAFEVGRHAASLVQTSEMHRWLRFADHFGREFKRTPEPRH
jgi:hypothetical protein